MKANFPLLMNRDRTSSVVEQRLRKTKPDSGFGGTSALCLPELLAPAGDWACARAAIENGADAIYFGLEKFSARMRAQNFTEADLPKLMEFLHQRGVKGYLTFNILVFENEMPQAEAYVRAMIAAGVDAAVVQDVGICRLIRRLSPDFPIHASTQMTITSAGGIEFARDLGCNLVVLARECSLWEIEKIQAAQAANSPPSGLVPKLPLEVFIHGALCVAYSGQCLTSEALGGRSANRGECAQACRMPYDLIADGRQVPLGNRKYLLSPQDLAGLEVLPALVRSGVSSLKIEGRLKSPEYVANITRIYRQALDSLSEGHEAESKRKNIPATPAGPYTLDPSSFNYEMGMAFSRGLYTGWFRGTNNQQLVHGRFGKKRGIYLGEISQIKVDRVCVGLRGPVKPGDGVVFDAGNPEQEEEGGRVYTVEKHGAETWLGFGQGDLNFHRIHAGDKLWKTSDPELDHRLHKTYAGDKPRFQRPLQMEVYGAASHSLTLIGRDELGNVVQVESNMPLVEARKRPLKTGQLREQLGRLGGTPFKLGELKNLLRGNVLLPVSELNRLRRELVTALQGHRARPPGWTLLPALSVTRASSTIHPDPAPSVARPCMPQLLVLVRSLAQLEAALQSGVRTIYCEFEDPKIYRDAVAMAHHRDLTSGNLKPEIFVAPPRIFKMGEEWTLKQVRSCDADGYLVRNYDQLNFFAGERRIGDYSLNIANVLTADYFKNKFALERITASYDLNFMQLEALLQAAPPEWFEVTIHQHMPMFHMEHCLFCAFLTNGTDYTDCGRPCDTHNLKLRDRVGAEHPVKADVGCRNTVFHALAQTGADYATRMLALGVRFFRIEFLDETPALTAQTISKYRQLLCGELTGTQLWRELKLLNQLGVTRSQIGAQKP